MQLDVPHPDGSVRTCQNIMMPIDPINDPTYYYSYFQNGSGYELNARLEFSPDLMQNDGGNDPDMYEIGNNLLLISP
jgi:hypothetical protein